MMWSLLFVILLVRFGLLSGHLCGNCCGLGWPYGLIHFCLFLFFIYFPFLGKSGLVSFKTDHSILCVLVAFLTKPKPHFKVLPGHLQYLACAIYYDFHVKMLISHDKIKYFLPIFLKK